MTTVKIEIEFKVNRPKDSIDIDALYDYYRNQCKQAYNNDNMLYDWKLNLDVKEDEDETESC